MAEGVEQGVQRTRSQRRSFFFLQRPSCMISTVDYPCTAFSTPLVSHDESSFKLIFISSIATSEVWIWACISFIFRISDSDTELPSSSGLQEGIFYSKPILSEDPSKDQCCQRGFGTTPTMKFQNAVIHGGTFVHTASAISEGQ